MLIIFRSRATRPAQPSPSFRRVYCRMFEWKPLPAANSSTAVLGFIKRTVAASTCINAITRSSSIDSSRFRSKPEAIARSIDRRMDICSTCRFILISISRHSVMSRAISIICESDMGISRASNQYSRFDTGSSYSRGTTFPVRSTVRKASSSFVTVREGKISVIFLLCREPEKA